MKLRVKVDQAECFRLGLDAPRSSVDVEVNPSRFPQNVRDYIADHLKDGIRLDLEFANPKPTPQDIEKRIAQMLRK
jgi:hypothetical protein